MLSLSCFSYLYFFCLLLSSICSSDDHYFRLFALTFSPSFMGKKTKTSTKKQGIVITDPVLARHVLRSKYLDKFRFVYSFLDEFLGGTSVLTGHTNGHWKAVRKGVANAFSMASMRSAFDVISGCCDKLQDILEVRALASGAPARQPAPVNVDNMLLRESMDVISVVGFERSIGALDSFDPRGDGNGIALNEALHAN